jgi:hypothetical protein
MYCFLTAKMVKRTRFQITLYVHCKLRKEKSNKMQQRIKIFIIPYLYKAPQHVSGDTSPIIRNQNLYWQPLVFHTVCLTTSTNHTSNNFRSMKNQSLPKQFLAPDDWAVCRPKHVDLYINVE